MHFIMYIVLCYVDIYILSIIYVVTSATFFTRVRALLVLRLHYFDLLWICCACCLTNPHHVEVVEFEYKHRKMKQN